MHFYKNVRGGSFLTVLLRIIVALITICIDSFIPDLDNLYTVFKLKFPIRFLKKFSAYNEAAETCNTVMERKFYGLLWDVFKNCEKFSYEA